MDYLYENLGDERFQELCNTLISKEFPDTQSFPVGQPDGGRDSVVYLMDSNKKQFIVFQIKFVRDPNLVSEPHKWLTKILKDESPKINKLIPKGAIKFYLLTNVKGTAHLDSGSKDKVNKILEEEISIPALCWWRDDISRIFEKDPIFMWSYPEILNGQNIMNMILFQNINENKENRESTIKAYLADQYSIDNEVKFRQIDLQNKLLDLFTDVPIKIKKLNEKNRDLKRTLDFFENHRRYIYDDDNNIQLDERDNLGAAAFLLHPKIQNRIERILLEGGPGQGKSTISQYICQVHRIRLLNKIEDLKLIPDNLNHSPVRLPFKIDLRHIASWVENKNPYQGMLSDEYYIRIWKNSLESFLIGHIIYHSQIDTFDAADLISILKNSSVLFVFDGFDEIADLKIRKEVIEFINKGVNRIKEYSKSIQILITSRPAAFSDTIGFSVDIYPHFELTDITPRITKEYVEKWVKSSKLDSRESAEIKRLVEEKLQMPHLRDLAKSPMQLAIFLSLLKTRGESLPNKRTALYDSYIDLFFNRESEKNPTIRDHRDLIIDIHQYLAWILHSEAELLNNSGSITIEQLQVILKAYLTKEGHKTDIADQLFHVMEERVCALVSRVQGTYEFEVQPLREYFCARFLYNTSPYSPVGSENSGTKPERFNAIAHNFYWHNVVRFFAGCFDRGELPMLIQELKELQEDGVLKFTNYPRVLTAQILSDWVFTQYPLLLKDVVKIIIDGINIGNIINQDGRFIHNEPIILPAQCGRSEMIAECFNQLKSFPHNDYAYELIGLIRSNPFEIEIFWIQYLNELSGINLVKWLEYAYVLQIIHKISDEILLKILRKDDINLQENKIQILINGNKLDLICNNSDLKQILFQGILNGRIQVIQRGNNTNSMQFLSILLSPDIISNILQDNNINASFLDLITHIYRFHHRPYKKQGLTDEFIRVDQIDNDIWRFYQTVNSLFESNVSEWRKSIANWDIVVENFRNSFGEKWSFKIMAVIVSGIKSREETFDDFDDLTNIHLSLCKRVRCARMKSGNVNYWSEMFDNSNDIIFTLLVFFTWATPNAIINLFEKISEIFYNLDSEESKILIHGLSDTVRQRFTNHQTRKMQFFLKEKQNINELKYIISYKFPEEMRREFIYENINNISNEFKENIFEIKLEYLINNFINDTTNEHTLSEIKVYYSLYSNFKVEDYIYHRHYRNFVEHIPISIASKIMSDSKSYPRIIASIAERSCRIFANQNTKAVGQIANENKWFE